MTRDEFNKVLKKQDETLAAAKDWFEQWFENNPSLGDVDPDDFEEFRRSVNNIEHAAMVVFDASNEVVGEADILQGLDGDWCLVNIKAPYEQGVVWGSKDFLGRELAGIMGLVLSKSFTEQNIIACVADGSFRDWRLFDKNTALQWLKDRR